ncbi:MAG: serine hydrolase, partial [Planctomycetota bacterium]
MICGMPGEVAAGFFRSVMAGEESVSVKSRALFGVRFEPDDETLGRIVSILSPASKASDYLRAAARSALTRIGTPRARAALEKAFRVAVEDRRYSLAESLTRLGSGAGIPLLEKRLEELRARGPGQSELDGRMRAVAVESLEKLLAKSRLLPVLVPVREKHDLPALAGAVVTSKGLVAVGATGVRRRGTEVKATAEDLWHIGSCTKSMTATLVGRLVEQGKLRWATTLAEALPGLEERMRAEYRKVTLADLLSHRAGAPRDLRPGGLWARLWTHPGPPVAAR